jgi:hypothetical protein
MRVEYTLPGMQPPVNPQMVQAANAGGPYGPNFKDRLRQLSANFQLNWRHVLRLDQVPPGATVVGPPPKPTNLELKDPAAARLQWRRLVDRNSQQLMGQPNANTTASTPSPKVQRMQALLIQMQQMEDNVTSRSLTATRG